MDQHKGPGIWKGIKRFFFKNLTAIFCVVGAVAVTYTITYTSCVRSVQQTMAVFNETGVDINKIAQVALLYQAGYVGGELDGKTMTDYALYGLVQGTGDKYGTYVAKDDFTRMMDDTQGELVGIGVNVTYRADLNTIRVMSVMEGSSAQAAGILPNDYLVAVDGQQLSEIGYYAFVQAITGEEGTEVTVDVERDGQLLSFTMQRTRIDVQSVTMELVAEGVPRVTITEFNEKTPEQFALAMEQVNATEGLRGLIFDVRNNPGGNADAVGVVLDSILPECTVYRLVDNQDQETVRYDSDAATVLPGNIPVVVLCNNNTASAAELFTASLQDMKLATIVGETTYGKGTGVQILGLGDGSGLVMSTELYYTPADRNLEGVGVVPDVEVIMTDEQMAAYYDLTVEQDPQLQKALEIVNAG